MNASASDTAHPSRGIAFGGGGLWFLTWTLAYCSAAKAAGIPLDQVDKTVGTSAGSLAGAFLTSGHLDEATQRFTQLAANPDALRQLVALPEPSPSAQRAIQVLSQAPDTSADTLMDIGRAAMAAHTPSPQAYVESCRTILGGMDWPDQRHHITAVDCYTADRMVFDSGSGVDLATACAASSSLPGVNGPTWVNDQLCMDGGISSSSTHSDVVGDCDRVLLISLLSPDSHPQGAFGLAQRTNPSQLPDEMARIEAAGHKTMLVCGDPPADINLMDPDHMQDAIDKATAQFAQEEAALRQFWND